MITTLATVWFLHVASMMSPGPNVLLVSQLAASDRGRSAAFAAMGIATGALVWATCAVLGVHVVFQAFPALRLAMQFAGGAYLLYVAALLWRSSGAAPQGRVPSRSKAAAFRLGLLTNLTNPKSALFFGSVFAASFPASPSPLLQASAVTLIVCDSYGWHTLLAYAFSRERVRAAYARAGGTVRRAASVAMGVLGFSLLAAALREARP